MIRRQEPGRVGGELLGAMPLACLRAQGSLGPREGPPPEAASPRLRKAIDERIGFIEDGPTEPIGRDHHKYLQSGSRDAGFAGRCAEPSDRRRLRQTRTRKTGVAFGRVAAALAMVMRQLARTKTAEHQRASTRAQS